MKRTKKSLKLRKRTLRALNSKSLDNVQGGAGSQDCAGTNAPRATQLCW